MIAKPASSASATSWSAEKNATNGALPTIRITGTASRTRTLISERQGVFGDHGVPRDVAQRLDLVAIEIVGVPVTGALGTAEVLGETRAEGFEAIGAGLQGFIWRHGRL